MTRKTPYQILGVSRNADMPTIKRAYRSLYRQFHPDRADQTAEAHKHFLQIQDAYNKISKMHNKRNGSDGETDRNHHADKEQPWDPNSTEYAHILYMNRREATEEVSQLHQEMQFFLIQVRRFFIRFTMVCPRSKKRIWAILDRNLRTLEATLEQATICQFQIRLSISKTHNDKLRFKFEQMKDIQRQLESTARVVEKASIETRHGVGHLLRTQAARWP
ncbi:hypothetical protein F4801DRAFT_585106 [Xylaria longipes]|nr:hypothetical protein F4801DRAFT_585106 [Xylaria longipes]